MSAFFGLAVPLMWHWHPAIFKLIFLFFVLVMGNIFIYF